MIRREPRYHLRIWQTLKQGSSATRFRFRLAVSYWKWLAATNSVKTREHYRLRKVSLRLPSVAANASLCTAFCVTSIEVIELFETACRLMRVCSLSPLIGFSRLGETDILSVFTLGCSLWSAFSKLVFWCFSRVARVAVAQLRWMVLGWLLLGWQSLTWTSLKKLAVVVSVAGMFCWHQRVTVGWSNIQHCWVLLSCWSHGSRLSRCLTLSCWFCALRVSFLSVATESVFLGI